MLTYFLFAAGFVLLIKGADWLIEGAVSLSQRLEVPDIVVGLTVVAFGTSAPELAVNIIASVKGNNGLAIGNIVGSNIANVLLILGVAGLVRSLSVRTTTTWREIPFSLLAAVVLGIVANDALLFGAASSEVGRLDGLLLIGFFCLFMWYTFRLSKGDFGDDVPTPTKMPVPVAVGLFVVGLAGLVVGGKWIVDGAVAIAMQMGLSESFVGLTVVAVGTSLPELATSVAAVRKGKTDLAIGNVVGSNIFNIFWVLGVSSVISPIAYSAADNLSMMACIGSGALLFVLLFVGRRHVLQRWEAGLMLALYAAYLVVLTRGASA